MPELYRIHEAPELIDPVLIVGLDGWIDAGYAAANAVGTMLEGAGYVTIASFDTDVLLDHRSRRPTMHIDDGITTGLTWPTIELRAATDANGGEALFLVGAEPDHLWRAFSSAVVDLAHEFGVSEVVSLGAYPAAVPHTRPVRVIATSTSAEQANRVGTVAGRVDVPAGIHAAIEMAAAESGLPALSLWAQVPHYSAAMPYQDAVRGPRLGAGPPHRARLPGGHPRRRRGRHPGAPRRAGRQQRRPPGDAAPARGPVRRRRPAAARCPRATTSAAELEQYLRDQE